MRTQRTHLLALRAAMKVSSVSRALRRAAVSTAVGAALLLAPVGCSTSDSGTATPVDGGDDVSSSEMDAGAQGGGMDALLDVILGEDAGSVGGDSGAVVADSGGSGEDAGAGDDGGPAPMDAGATIIDEGGAPDGSGGQEDIAASADSTVIEEDAALADAGEALPEDCLVPNGLMCDAMEDCVEEGKTAVMCVEGQCHEQDITPNEVAQACCFHAYEQGMSPAGCNPWGPPAPPADRGHRLTEIA